MFYLKKFLFCVIFLIFINRVYAMSGIRPDMFAGKWYPSNKEELYDMVNKFLSQAKLPYIKGKIKAIIVPHAGYMFSGAVAAYAFKAIKGEDFTRVIMIGPSHRSYFQGISVNIQEGYKTPFGIVPVDRDFGEKLIKSSPMIGYIPVAHSYEHCLEVELPFLQTVLKKFKIVPILLGQQDMGTCKELARCLLRLLKKDKEKTLILASSDLSHYHSYDEAVRLDHVLIDDVKEMDPYKLYKDLVWKRCEACGKGAILTLLLIARELGITKSIVLKYANSGDVTGYHMRVVGYMSAVILK